MPRISCFQLLFASAFLVAALSALSFKDYGSLLHMAKRAVRQAFNSADELGLFAGESNDSKAVSIITLKNEDFEDFLNKHEVAFVDFCSSKSRICRTHAEQLDEFHQLARGQGLSFGFAKVDCLEEEDLCERQKLQAFPSMRWYHKNGDKHIYHGQKSAQQLLDISRVELGHAKDLPPENVEPMEGHASIFSDSRRMA